MNDRGRGGDIDLLGISDRLTFYDSLRLKDAILDRKRALIDRAAELRVAQFCATTLLPSKSNRKRTSCSPFSRIACRSLTLSSA